MSWQKSLRSNLCRQVQVRIRLETIAIFSVLQRIKEGEFSLLWSFMIDYEKRDSLKLQEELFEGMTVDEIYKKAEEHFEKKQRKGQTKSVL